MLKVIDLFSGCGGFSLGFAKAGYKIVSAVEIDKEIAQTFQINHLKTKVYIEDIKNIDNNSIFRKGQADVVIGGPPCQGFSMAGARNRNGFLDDPRNYLFKHYFNVVKVVGPKIFVLENVKGLLNMSNGQIMNQIIKIFQDPNNFDGKPYKVQYKIIKTEEFGIPQKRERVILIGSRVDFNLEKEIEETIYYIKKNVDEHFFDKVTIEDAISDLPKPTKDGKVENLKSKTYFQEYLSSSNGLTTNHIATKHSNIALERIKKIGINQNFTVLKEDIKSIHSGSYGRMNPKGQSATITTRFDTPSGGRFIHPYENRTITPREAARIQCFPDNFYFYGSKTSIQKQIGNAVPPKIAYFIAIMTRSILCKKDI
jgi:DNA (cytosine-5)-methyltransferase 1